MTLSRAFGTHPLKSLMFTAALGLGAFGSAQAATTYHVRTDGGDASQCTGRADAPYPGSGTGQACAWKHPFLALEPAGVKRIVGGDTVIIGSGSYMMGQGAPGGGNCSGSNCFMSSIPSGPTATARTRFIGKAGAAAPKLWGSGGASKILNLEGSSNVEVGFLDVTDQSDCVYSHSNSTAACPSPGSGAWGKTGLSARASSNVWLHDVNIHGMGHQGVYAGGLTNWTVERVKIIANGRVGWDGNIGTASSNSGAIVMRDIEIAWNGCGERWQTGTPWACWAQQTGGYGDGLGTYYTGGQWLIEDAFIHHNTSDGLDLRYMDGADGTNVMIRRLHAVGNAGNQVKVRGNSTIENSVLISNCGYFEGKYYMLADDNCRANGNTLVMVMTANDRVTVRHNTITGEGGVLMSTTEGDSTGRVTIQNNLVVGFMAHPTVYDGLAALHYANNAPAPVTFVSNLIWNVRNGTCPTGSICGQNPKLTNMTLDAFDAELLAGSPAIDKVPLLSGITTDFLMQPRPSGSATDIGAYELQAGGTVPAPEPEPTPTCTRAQPAMSLTGPTLAVVPGTKVDYTLNLTNKDSSGCANTSFSLARTVPTGWTGALSATSVTLAPGASSNTVLSVTSPSGSADGSYGISAGTSSSVGSTHTASAQATYAVKAAETAPTCDRATPTVSLTGPTAAVAAGTTATYTLTMKNNDGACFYAKTFKLAASVPAGWNGILANSSLLIEPGSTATTTLSVTSATNATAGSYGVGIGISSSMGSIHTANASATYSVLAPVVVAPSNLTGTVGTDKTSYVRGQTVYISTRVLLNDLPVSGAAVRFGVLMPNGTDETVLTAVTDGSGYARTSYQIGKGMNQVGTNKVRADVTSGSRTATASTSFSVSK